MKMAPAAPLLSFLLMMLVIVSTGTAWFVALHPRFVWRMFRGSRAEEMPSAADYRMLRLGGIGVGIVGMALILLTDFFT